MIPEPVYMYNCPTVCNMKGTFDPNISDYLKLTKYLTSRISIYCPGIGTCNLFRKELSIRKFHFLKKKMGNSFTSVPGIFSYYTEELT